MLLKTAKLPHKEEEMTIGLLVTVLQTFMAPTRMSWKGPCEVSAFVTSHYCLSIVVQIEAVAQTLLNNWNSGRKVANKRLGKTFTDEKT